MKYENKLLEHDCRVAVRNALVRWVFGNDGYEGAIGGVTGKIPWKFDENDNLLWDKWADKFDEAIGGRSRWDVVEVLNNQSRRLDFDNFIDKKLNRITKVYQRVVDELNGSRRYCGIVEKFVGVDEKGVDRYETIERICNETKFGVVQLVWEKYACMGKWEYCQFVDAMFSGNSVGLALPGHNLYAKFCENAH